MLNLVQHLKNIETLKQVQGDRERKQSCQKLPLSNL
jgi:hypothetical protein